MKNHQEYLFKSKYNPQTPKPTTFWQKPSLAYFIVREVEDTLDVHVSFEYKNKEYNYGPASESGPIILKIPLEKSKTGPAPPK